MSLRIIGNNALTNAPNSDLTDVLRSSVQLVSSAQNSVPVFDELDKAAPRLAECAEMVRQSLEDLNKMLSVVDRLVTQFSRLSESSSTAEIEAVASVVRYIVRSVPGRRVMELFDPRRSEERFRNMLGSPALYTENPAEFVKSASDALNLLNETEKQLLYAISSKERFLHLADIEQENINAQKSIFNKGELLALYKLLS